MEYGLTLKYQLSEKEGTDAILEHLAEGGCSLRWSV